MHLIPKHCLRTLIIPVILSLHNVNAKTILLFLIKQFNVGKQTHT